MSMIKLFFVLLLFFSVKSHGQSDSVMFEQSGEKYCKIYGNSRKDYLKECYLSRDSTLLYSEYYVDTKLSGLRTIYFPDGKLFRQECYEKGILIGSFWEYESNGRLIIKGSFGTRDSTNSEEQEYCEDVEFVSVDNPGIAKAQYCFSSPRQGKWIYYADNGIKYCEGEYSNNKRVGRWIFYDIYTGKIEKIVNY